MTFIDPEMPQDCRVPADPNYYMRPARDPRAPVPVEQPDPLLESGNKFSTPPTFGDERSRRQHADDVQALADSTPFRWTVSVGCTVSTPRGVLRERAELKLEDVAHDRHVMLGLVRRGVVLELGLDVVESRRAPAGERTRYRVHQALIGSVGGFPAGQWVGLCDFRGQPGEPARDAQPARLDPATGNVLPAEAAAVARPEITPAQQLATMVELGYVVDTTGEQLPTRAAIERLVRRGNLKQAALAGPFADERKSATNAKGAKR